MPHHASKNGAISKEEVVSMARTLRISMPEETVMELMEGADVDQNGEVDFEEVCCRQRIGNWDPCTL
jgi:Ca2+-binding EF-hand superfamily protein